MNRLNPKKMNWEYITLDEVVDKGSSNISLNKIKEDEGDYPIYSAKGFYKNISFYHQEKEYIAIIKDGAGIGRLSVHPPKSSVVGTMQYLIPKEGFDLMFVKYFLTGINFNLYKQGATIPHIYFKDYKAELVPKLSIEEQKRIVAKIDTLFAKIDNAISLTEESLKQAMNLLARIIDETFDSFDAEKVDLKSVSNSIQYGYTGKTIEKGKYYYLRITDIQGGMVNYESTPYSDIDGIDIEKYRLNKGDILFARTGATAGKSYLFNDDVEAVFASYLIRVVCNQNIVKPSFVKWFFLSSNYWKQIFGNIVGAAQPNFNGKKLGELNLKIPSIEQQELVIGYLEKVSKQTKQTQSKLKEQLVYLKQLKSSILSKAFTGEL